MEKILERVKVTPTEYWEWSGACNNNGYGQVWCSSSKKLLYVHHVMAEVHKGSTVLHSCDNPRYCNPEHLTVGTPKENSADMVGKARSHRGYKLKGEDVISIMQSAESGAILARSFNVSQQTICDIRNGRRHDRL